MRMINYDDDDDDDDNDDMVGCLYLLSFISQLNAGDPCLARDFGHSSIVCVCNRTYCDTYDTVQGKYSALCHLLTALSCSSSACPQRFRL